MAMIDRLLSGPFDEVEFVCGRKDCTASRHDERALMVIKHVIDLRRARHQPRPLVAWLYADGGASTAEEVPQQVRLRARQLGVDRFDVVAVPYPELGGMRVE
jgi:hypothetical protein